MTALWIGIDTGGTFTDLVAVNLEDLSFTYHKVPTTSDDASRGILEGIEELLALAVAPAATVQMLCHGTTLATNAVLQGKLAPAAMLTTAGFRDVLELARQRRPHFFNLDIPKPTPPTPRHLRMEVAERVGAKGEVITALSDPEVRGIIQHLKSTNVEAVAVCFMHSYANPDHEIRVRDLLREMWPEVYVCSSADLLPEFREFERFATTTINASLMPIVDRYLERFEVGVNRLGIEAQPRVMQSNGGAVSTSAVRRAPVNTFFSGPAGGVIGTARLCSEIGIGDVITFDMGGTSTDVCLIRNGVPSRKSYSEMGGFPVRAATLDLHTIGAGGGSIAWIDPGGLLKVGPQSAGAFPGPASYMRGGKLPTVTDANMVLGRLSQTSLLDGRMPVDPALARQVIEQEVCRSLNFDLAQAAAGIIDVVNANMMGAVRVITVEQGEDPRRFALVPFGGAGPLHAVDIATSMNIERIIVPTRPGILSAIGLLYADTRGDFGLTRLAPATARSLPVLQPALKHLLERAASWKANEVGRDGAEAELEWRFDMRYVGQNYEIQVALSEGEVDEARLHQLVKTFHTKHQAAYGYAVDDADVEIVNIRLSVTVMRPDVRSARHGSLGNIAVALKERRPVWFRKTGFVDTPVYDRNRMGPGNELSGPAIVEQMDATTVVPPGADLVVDEFGNLLITF